MQYRTALIKQEAAVRKHRPAFVTQLEDGTFVAFESNTPVRIVAASSAHGAERAALAAGYTVEHPHTKLGRLRLKQYGLRAQLETTR